MERAKSALFWLPTLICYGYALVVLAIGLDVAFFASPEVLAEYRFGDPQRVEQEGWEFRTRGHFFWYQALWAAVFGVLGVFFRRMLRS